MPYDATVSHTATASMGAGTSTDRDQMNCKHPANNVSLRAGQPIRASDDTNIYMGQMGGTDAAHRKRDCFDWLRRCRTAAAGLDATSLGGAAKIPGRPDLAADAAEQLDHRNHRRHLRRCAGPYLDQPAPKLARCPREARVDGYECDLLRAGAAGDRVRPGRQGGAGLGWGWPRLQVGQRWAWHLRRPQQ